MVSCLGLRLHTGPRGDGTPWSADALALTDRGQGQAALELLSPKELNGAGDPDFDSRPGVSRPPAAKPSRAIFALERVLAVQPTNGRAKAELGWRRPPGDNKGARTMFEQSKTQGAPGRRSRAHRSVHLPSIALRPRGNPRGAPAEATVGYDTATRARAAAAAPSRCRARRLPCLCPMARTALRSAASGLIQRQNAIDPSLVIDCQWPHRQHLGGTTRARWA